MERVDMAHIHFTWAACDQRRQLRQNPRPLVSAEKKCRNLVATRCDKKPAKAGSCSLWKTEADNVATWSQTRLRHKARQKIRQSELVADVAIVGKGVKKLENSVRLKARLGGRDGVPAVGRRLHPMDLDRHREECRGGDGALHQKSGLFIRRPFADKPSSFELECPPMCSDETPPRLRRTTGRVVWANGSRLVALSEDAALIAEA